MAHSLDLHSGIPVGDPIRMTLVSDDERIRSKLFFSEV